MAQLVIRPHALTDRNQIVSYAEGITIGEIVAMAQFPDELTEYVTAQIDGVEVPHGIWNRVTPKPNSHVLVTIVPKGSDDGKNVFRLIATIAISIYAPQVGLKLFGSEAWGGAIVMLAGSLAVNAVFPPPSISNAKLSEQSTESPTLNISGQRNAVAPYSPVIKNFGTNRIWPKNAAVPFVQTIGKRTQYIYMVLDFGYGPQKLSDHQIGDQPISQYEGVDLVVHEELTDGAELVLYTKDVESESFSVDLLKNTPQEFTVPVDSDQAQFDISFPQGLVVYDIEGNRKLTKVYFDVQFKKTTDSVWRRLKEASRVTFSRPALGDGNIVFPETPFNAIDYLGGDDISSGIAQISSLQGEDITAFSDYDPDIASGEGIAKVYGFRRGETTLVAEVVYPIPSGATFDINGTTYTVQNAVAVGSAKNVNISPALVDDVVTNSYLTDGTNKIRNLNYSFGITTYTNISQSIEVSDLTSEPFTFSCGLSFDERGDYEIKITRTTTVEETNLHHDKSTFTAIRGIKNEAPMEFDKPHTIVEMRIKATDQLNGIVDNYSAVASSVLPVWTGSAFELQETGNPAWCSLEVLRGKATPRPVADSKIDLNRFKEWADWCNRTAPNNNESYFRCDHVCDYRTTVRELFNSLASTGRGTESMLDGKYSVIYDEQPTVPVQLITTSNSSGFSGKRSFVDVPHAVVVRFIDPDSGWQQKDLTVYNDGYDKNTATIIEELPLLGVIRQTQAWREGRYFLAQGQLRQEQFTLTMDVENITFVKGDYVQVQHDVPRIGGVPSRITNVDGNDITVTEPFGSLNFGNTYKVTIRESNNSIKDYTVSAQVDGYTVTLAEPPTCEVGQLLSWGLIDYVTDDFIVKNIQPEPDLGATVTLVALAPAVYTADSDVIPPWSPKLSTDVQLSPPLVENLSVTQTLEYVDRLPMVSILIDWDKSDTGFTEVYEVYRLMNGVWKLLTIVEDTEYYYLRMNSIVKNGGMDIVGVEHKFKVLGVSTSGKKVKLDDAVEVSITPQGDTTPPAAVKNLQLDVITENVQLTWDSPDDEDIDGYLFRFSTNVDSPNWSSSERLVSKMPHNANSLTVNARTGSYLIRAIDTSGNLGLVSSVRTTIPSLVNLNVIDVIENGPIWDGTVDNLVIDITSGKMSLIDLNAVGYFYMNDKVVYPYAYPTRVSHSIDATAIVESPENINIDPDMELVKNPLSPTTPYYSDRLGLGEVSVLPTGGESGGAALELTANSGGANVISEPRKSDGSLLTVPATKGDKFSGYARIKHNGVVASPVLGPYHLRVDIVERDDSGAILGGRKSILRWDPAETPDTWYDALNLEAEAAMDETTNVSFFITIDADVTAGTFTVDELNIYKDTAETDGWSAKTEVRLQTAVGSMADWLDLTDTYVSNLATAAGTWSDWKPFNIADYTGANYEFRLKLESLDKRARPVISSSTINVDMVDRIASDNDVSSGTGGMTVAFDPYFYSVPAIAISAQGMNEGDRYRLTNKGIDGFDIEFYNSAGTSINRTFDWYAKGYGGLSNEYIG